MTADDMPRTCAACGAVNDSDRSFCQSCGGRLGPEPASPAAPPAVDAGPRDARRARLPGWILPVVAAGLLAGAAIVAASLLLERPTIPSAADDPTAPASSVLTGARIS
jgi:hypothetical protein